MQEVLGNESDQAVVCPAEREGTITERKKEGLACLYCSDNFRLEKTLESPLDCTEIQPVHSEGDQPWVFFGRNLRA